MAAPRGNLNRVASDPRGLALAYWRRRALLPESRWVLAIVQSYLDERTTDLGGDDNVTAGQRALLSTSAIAQAVVALILAESKRRGGYFRDTDAGLDLTPALKELPKFLARVQAAETALGLAPIKSGPDADAFALMRRPAKVIDVEAAPVE